MSVAGTHTTLKFDVSRKNLVKLEGMTGVKINCRKKCVKTRVFSRRGTFDVAYRPGLPYARYENLAR